MATSAEYRLGEYPFGRGWYAVANAAEVGREPFNVHYFGQDMVLYRGESGRVVMLDAYCPHMGTHFGKAPHSSTSVSETFLEGDSIRCPFHAWRFGPDGACNHIPYHDGPIPPAARVRSWRVEERYGIVFCWHDPEGLEPDFDIADFPEWGQLGWVSWAGLEHLCDLQHPIEIFDNMSDVRHLDHLHGTRVKGYENEYDGPVMHQREAAAIVEDNGQFGDTLTTLSGYVGPGIAFGHFLELNAKEIICATPIDDGTSRLWQAALMKVPAGMAPEQAEQVRRGFSDSFASGLKRDGEVWATKKPALVPMQMPGDGPFRQSRTWYSQFFNPRTKTAEILCRLRGIYTAKGMPPFTPMPEAAE
ncbi:MAG: Rieske (2Fe-2S) protein [Novosphingobium sp.]|nr:Rieske (2Fe-2S) protein [Novosphingobium sp.]